MIQQLLVVLFLFGVNCSSTEPPKISNYLGGWSGELLTIDQFRFDFTLDLREEESPLLTVIGPQLEFQAELVATSPPAKTYRAELPNGVILKLDLSATQPLGFLQTGHHLCYLNFESSPASSVDWRARWNLLLADQMDPTFYLSLDRLDEGGYSASTFFQSPVCHYMYAQDFQLNDDGFSFVDIRSGIEFKGKLLAEDQIELVINYLRQSQAFTLQRLDYDQWQTGDSDLPVAPLASRLLATNSIFTPFIADLEANRYPGTHSILVNQDGERKLEYYAPAFSANTLHDTRSLSKSFAAAAVGLAIQNGYLDNEQALMQGFFPTEDYPSVDWSNEKSAISIHHLLTMSSGLDAIDFGINRTSYANEGAYQSQSNWTSYILQAPMLAQPGQVANYGSANPHLVGAILATVVEEDLAFFLHKHLFGALGFDQYRLQTSTDGIPYFGGGWYFQPDQLSNFAEMLLEKGAWEGREILTDSWVTKCKQKYGPLLNTNDQNQYGYLLWHQDYDVKGVKYASIEGRGAGGQYFFVIPDLNLSAVITSGNYRSGNPFLPEQIMEEAILPLILGR
ncbi:MAG: serine hydrolase [Bacteroidota bacterium]